MPSSHRLDRVFNPRVVVVVGDKRAARYVWLKNVHTFQGQVYSVQIDPNEIPGIEELGVKNYLSLLDVPDPIDYVIVAVPRKVAPRIVQDCITKGVGGATLFTSGFAETATEEGVALQARIAEMAKKADFKLIGPNCMGIFNPRIGLRHSLDQYAGEGGPAGFIAQSGTQNTFFSLLGGVNGVKVSKSVSYGNAIVLDSPDYLEYLAQDEDTKVIGMYIEGARDGRRLFRTLREVAARKPVFIWKGGQTPEGARATSSHTGSLMESMLVWDAIHKQCGTVRVDSMEEMVDAIKMLLHTKPGTGDRVGLVAMTGGQSVAITDAFARNGLQVPLLSQASYDRLGAFFNEVGCSYRNPLDAGSTFAASFENLVKMLDIMKDDGNIDVVVLEISVALFHRRWRLHEGFWEKLVRTLVDFKARCDKPFLTTLSPIHMEAETVEFKKTLVEANIPSFATFDSAAKALKRVVDYYRFHGTEIGREAGFGVE